MKRDDITDTESLIELLVLWWRYESQYTPVRGFPHSAAGMDSYRTSRQHDSENGALETDQRGKLAARVGSVVNQMPEPERSALYHVAWVRATGRNEAKGAAVWHSPRLPADATERARVVANALDIFAVMI